MRTCVGWLHVTDTFPFGLLDPKHVRATILRKVVTFYESTKYVGLEMSEPPLPEFLISSTLAIVIIVWSTDWKYQSSIPPKNYRMSCAGIHSREDSAFDYSTRKRTDRHVPGSLSSVAWVQLNVSKQREYYKFSSELCQSLTNIHERCIIVLGYTNYAIIIIIIIIIMI